MDPLDPLGSAEADPGFALAVPEIPGLDLSQFINPSRGPSIQPNRPLSVPPPRGGGQGGQWQQMAPLLAILPALLKGGHGTAGVAAFLQGVQQARQQKQQQGQSQQQQQFQNQRLTESDARAEAAQSDLAQYRQETIGNQQKAAAAKFLQDIAAKLAVAETPEQIEGIKQMAALAGPFVGVEPHAIEAVAAKAAPTSSSLIERQIKKVVAGLKPEDIDQYLQSGASLKVPGQAMPIPVQEWSKYLARGVDPTTGQPMLSAKDPTKPDTRGLDVQAADALARGDVVAYRRLKRVADEMSGARQNPPSADPEIALLRKDLLRIQVEDAGREKVPDQGQFTAATYAGRMEQADPILTAVEPAISKMSLPTYELQTNSWFARPTFQSKDVQSYMQAARNFINAVLRRESGAVISPSEFAEARQQYLPQPGDTDQALTQKAANRAYVFATMKRAAGRAYEAPVKPTPKGNGDGEFMHPKLGRVRVVGKNPDGTVRVEKVIP